MGTWLTWINDRSRWRSAPTGARAIFYEKKRTERISKENPPPPPLPKYLNIPPPPLYTQHPSNIPPDRKEKKAYPDGKHAVAPARRLVEDGRCDLTSTLSTFQQRKRLFRAVHLHFCDVAHKHASIGLAHFLWDFFCPLGSCHEGEDGGRRG
jgi:hypothetical protein